MFILRLLSAIFLTKSVVSDVEITCPPNEVLFPCNCDSEVAVIMCDIKDAEICNIENITSKISEVVQNKSVHFELAIGGVKLTKLKEKSLGSVLYSRIAIIDTGLKSIHKNVFSHTSHVTYYIDLEGNHLKNDVFDALRSLPTLTYINLSRNKLTVIPSHAFRHTNGQFQSRLRVILLTQNDIHTISGHAFFYLPHVSHLDISENELDLIGDQAFDFDDIPIGRQIHLTIDLAKNKLHSNSFNEKTLANIHRPVKLKIASNNFTHLSESIFKPFLYKHENNSIDVEANPLYCDCSSLWLHRNMHIYRNKVLNHVCKDNRILWSYNHSEFNNCDNSFFL
ncbi:Leucine rich repeat containing protein 10-like protein [Dinothrombium tinctorium]|uniref:Leucine rich repeat containing protein 10-like protein n=1 Tax=Dinothrombium tinctorium TaxID=1965070 RepID=A0A443QYA5_9ACAR|nr:Leucine rich repeat containing protein 10-like protein [Dinothrombium tinctorium]